MTVRPILFSGPMVRALLEGRKRQTRRLLNRQPICLHDQWPDQPPRMVIDEDGAHCAVCGAGMELDDRRPSGVRGIPVRYAVGDLMWVRESWRVGGPNQYALPKMSVCEQFQYRSHTYGVHDSIYWQADFDRSGKPQWFPGIHMRAWMSRLTLEVTDVRVQRLQDITEDDAIAEGAMTLPTPFGGWGLWTLQDSEPADGPPPQLRFAHLWNTINAGEGVRWAANPWVVAVTFVVHKANVDALLKQREAA